MSTEVISIYPPGALERLGRALHAYGPVSGRTSEEVLAKKGEDLAMRQPGGNSLHALFKAQAQKAGTITTATALRGFRLGRRRFGGRGAAHGISETAADRARNVMGEYLVKHSILAAPRFEAGRISLNPIRVGIRGRRLRGRHITAYGKRARMSNRGRTGLAGFAIGGDSELRQPGEKRMNFRAVATVMEINLREAGRKYLAMGFLFRRFQRIKKERKIVSTNPRAQLAIQAEASLEGRPETGDMTLRLTSRIPGTFEIGAGRALFSRALHFMTADLEDYLARKQRESLVREVRKAVA
jgi:hypothetical protein